MPLVSIIVPVYNSGKYLKKCLDSILSQSFSDFELLLVDDGSEDSSGRICDEYASEDDRVKAFHKANGGVSSARNFGLERVNGELVSFVDSDDRLDPDYLSVLLEGKDCDLSVCNYRIEESEKKWEVTVEEGIQDKDSIRRLFDEGRFDGCSFLGPVCKLFRREIIMDNNIRFKENIYSGEDSLFVLEYFCHIDNYYGSDKKTYHYRNPGNGLSAQLNLADCFLDFAKEAIRISGTLHSRFGIGINHFLSSFLNGFLNAYMKKVILENKLRKEDAENLLDVIPKEIYSGYISKYGRSVRVSRLFYSKRLFNLFIGYLRLLKIINHPFVRTLG